MWWGSPDSYFDTGGRCGRSCGTEGSPLAAPLFSKAFGIALAGCGAACLVGLPRTDLEGLNELVLPISSSGFIIAAIDGAGRCEGFFVGSDGLLRAALGSSPGADGGPSTGKVRDRFPACGCGNSVSCWSGRSGRFGPLYISVGADFAELFALDFATRSVSRRFSMLRGPPEMLDKEGLRIGFEPEVLGRCACVLKLSALGGRMKSSLLLAVVVLLWPCTRALPLLLKWNGPGAIVFILCRTLPPPLLPRLNGAWLGWALACIPDSGLLKGFGGYCPSTGVDGEAGRDFVIGKGGKAQSCGSVRSDDGDL